MATSARPAATQQDLKDKLIFFNHREEGECSMWLVRNISTEGSKQVVEGSEVECTTLPRVKDAYYLFGPECVSPAIPLTKIPDYYVELMGLVFERHDATSASSMLTRPLQEILPLANADDFEIYQPPYGDLIREIIFDGVCGYEECDDGFLEDIDEDRFDVPGIYLLSRHNNPLFPKYNAIDFPPICPFCMGAKMSYEDETFLLCWAAGVTRDPQDLIKRFNRLNLRRWELGRHWPQLLDIDATEWELPAGSIVLKEQGFGRLGYVLPD